MAQSEPISIVKELGGVCAEVSGSEWLRVAATEYSLASVLLRDEAVETLSIPSELVNLTYLALECPKLRRIEVEDPMTCLQGLWIGGCELQTFSFARKMPHLARLSTHGDRCMDLDGLSHHEHLVSLLIPGTHSLDFAAIETLKRLTSLSLLNTRCKNVNPILRGKPLVVLSIARTALTNLDGFDRIEDLLSFSASECSLDRLDELRPASKLASLYMRGTRCPDYEVLSALSGLKELELSGSDFTDARVLSGCGMLETLSVRLVPLKTLEPLSDLPRLGQLRLSADMTELDGLQALKRRGVVIVVEGYPNRSDRKRLRDLSWTY